MFPGHFVGFFGVTASAAGSMGWSRDEVHAEILIAVPVHGRKMPSCIAADGRDCAELEIQDTYARD